MDSRWADTTDEEDAGLDIPVEPSEDAVAPQEVSALTRLVENHVWIRWRRSVIDSNDWPFSDIFYLSRIFVD